MISGAHDIPASPLTVHLYTEDKTLPEGRALSTLPGARAVLDREHLHVMLDAPSLAERRYVFDHLFRKLRSLYRVGKVSLATTTGVDEDTVASIALDLRSHTDGQLTVDRASVEPRVDREGEGEALCREWVNEDPSTRTSIAIARDVASWARETDHVTATIMENAELQERGMALLSAVGSGSEASPPRLVIAEYHPPGADGPPLALVGKGVTFDSGGINVKPYESFVSMMKNDMGGAALAYSLFRTLVVAKHPEPLLLVIPTCENAIDGKSMRPGALIKGHAGITVRVDHTDAEGRLILADALSYACETYSPKEILTFATLTTSALISYGPYATPVHFATERQKKALQEAAAETGEDLHFFPERVWHRQANRDLEGDLRNTGRLNGNASRGAGSRNAAHFLLYFADAPLCHFDIFASAWNWAGDAPGAGPGATGSPFRTLYRAIAHHDM